SPLRGRTVEQGVRHMPGIVWRMERRLSVVCRETVLVHHESIGKMLSLDPRDGPRCRIERMKRETKSVNQRLVERCVLADAERVDDRSRVERRGEDVPAAVVGSETLGRARDIR